MTEPIGVEETCAVAVVGGGTAGLAAAAELKRMQVGKVVVLEREAEAGGIPRHCGHYPFGLREHGRLMKGPDYAKHNRDAVAAAGVEIRTGATVTGLHPGGRLGLSTDAGTTSLSADRVVLCTGVREGSRAERFIGGDRPGGVISTGALQSMVYLKRIRPFRRPVILGSELVSFSAIQTCRHLGIGPVAMVEERDRLIVRQAFGLYLLVKRIPLFTGVTNPRILGREHVEALDFEDRAGDTKRIETDGVIVSGRFRPESALMRDSHLDVDPGTGGPVIDQFGRCSDPAYFATGNLLRPAETSGFCWQEGLETARRIARDLERGAAVEPSVVRIVPADPTLRFAVPQRIDLSGLSGGMTRLYLGLNRPFRGTIFARAGRSTVWTGRLNAHPGRRIQIPINGIVQAASTHDVELATGDST